MPELKALLFDLDGTLVLARRASWVVFRETNEHFGLGVDTAEDFFDLFNANFYESLDHLATTAGSDPAAVRLHFQDLLRRDYAPQLVPGAPEIIRQLASHYMLALISGNAMEAIRRVLLNEGLATCFAHVFAGDVHPNKQAAIEQFLADPSAFCGRSCRPDFDEDLGASTLLPQEVMLITDTVGDVEEALRCGIRVGAVAWGMHTAEDLEKAGAEFVCVWPEELVAYLGPGEVCAAGRCELHFARHAGSSSSSEPPVSEDSHGVDADLRRAAITRSRRRLAGSGSPDHACECAERAPSDGGGHVVDAGSGNEPARPELEVGSDQAATADAVLRLVLDRLIGAPSTGR